MSTSNHPLLENFDNLEEIAKKWQNHEESDTSTSHIYDDSAQQKLELDKSASKPGERQKKSSVPKQAQLLVQPAQQTEQMPKRNHTPQVIDEDTEHFKIKLEHLLNIFKSDATTEFMQMKKSMLEDQKQTIKSETERYLNMYEEKSAELNKARTTLADKIKDNESLQKRYEGFASLCGAAKNRFRLQKQISTYFNTFKQYKKYRALKKYKIQVSKQLCNKNLKVKSFRVLADNLRLAKSEKHNQQVQQAQLDEINEITCRFNKEIQMLREKLTETTSQLEIIQAEKINMQNDLKKAFMRGVCALNFEAMNILNTKQQPESNASQKIETQTQQISSVMDQFDRSLNMNSVTPSMVPMEQSNGLRSMPRANDQAQSAKWQTNSQVFGNAQCAQPSGYLVQNQAEGQMAPMNNRNCLTEIDVQNSAQSLTETAQENRKAVIFYKEPKIESKDHKWKDAPVVSLEKESEATSSSLPDFIGNKKIMSCAVSNQENHNVMNEGKIVRVTEQEKAKTEATKAPLKEQTKAQPKQNLKASQGKFSSSKSKVN